VKQIEVIAGESHPAGHWQRRDILIAVREKFDGRPTPLLDGAIQFHEDCIAAYNEPHEVS
jgi:hypothetical protein